MAESASAAGQRAPTFKALGLLLTYPSETLVLALPELAEVIRTERLLDAEREGALGALFHALGTQELLDSQATYVDLFDQRRALSLYLYEHLHGDSRDRGQAMVDLQTAYEGQGLFLDARELPDYVPLYCEFLAQIPLDAARASLGDTQSILAGIGARLSERNSPYSAVFSALTSLAVGAAKPVVFSEQDFAPDDFEALDREYEERAVEFGEGDAHDSCAPRSREPNLVQLRTTRDLV